MIENLNAGYGALKRLDFTKHGFGRVFVVCPTTHPDYENIKGVFKPDSNGIVRLFNTIATAQAAATASRGDLILVAEGHAETLTAAQALSKAGLTFIGLGRGRLAPTITVNGAVDGLDISAANVTVENFRFAAPETDEATAMINISGANVTLRNIFGIGSKTSKNFVDCITVASGADDLLLENIQLNNTTVAVNSFLSIEAAVARMRINKFYAFGDVATAGIIDGATATQIDWRGVEVHVVGTTKPAATLDSNPTGSIVDSKFSGTHGTLATNAALGTGVRLHNVTVLEETDGSKQGAQIPAVDVD